MQLSLLNFNAVVANSAAAVQGSCKKLLNLSVGSVLRSILESFASVALWIQYLIVQVWLGTRLATSTGVDADSFVGDFSLTRLPAKPSTGMVTFARPSSDIAALIVPYFLADGTVNTTTGVRVITVDGSQTFGVTIDTTNTRWQAGLGGYLVPVGTASVDLPVQAVIPGSASNVQAGTISLLASAVSGIDTVTNTAPFQNGGDAESDDSLKIRFQNYINTRARGTPEAVAFAVTSVQQGVTFSLRENVDSSGAYMPGHFIVTVDDGSGAPTPSFISAVYAAVDAVRPIGSTFAVLAPVLVQVTVSMAITVGSNGNKSKLIGVVEDAILDYIDALPIGGLMPWSRLAQLAYAADPNIINVSQILLNGSTLDVDPGVNGVVKASTVAIN